MVRLAERRRARLAELAPDFWRLSARASTWTNRYFRLLLFSSRTALLIAEDESGPVGMLIARRVAAPPVYDPGGATVLIDDFCVSGPSLWPTAGAALLEAARQHARSHSAAQLVVIAPAGEAAQAEWLAGQGLDPVTSWWVGRP